MKPAALLLISICLQAALFDVIGAAPQQQLCPNGKKNGDVWDESKGSFGFRKHCTVDKVNGGYCVQVLGCLSDTNEFIPRGEERIGVRGEGCPLVQRCIVNGTWTTYEWNYNCTVTGKPATAPPLPTATTKKEAAKTTVDAILTGRPVEQFCPNGKRNGEEWDDMKGSFGFRKHCTTDEVNGGYCVKVLGCIGYKGSFIKRGEELTEYWDEQCNIIQMCKITGDKGLTTEYETSYDCTRTRKPLSSPATGKPTKVTDKPTEKTTEKLTVRSTKPTDKPTVKPTEKTTEKPANPTDIPTKIQVPITPVTLPPIECPKGKREGDEWTEKTNGGSHGFRKRCENGCIVVIGCISQKGSFVKRGQNLTEIWNDDCDVITACIATDKTSTRVADNLFCTKETLIPRTTGKTTEKPTKHTEKSTVKPTKPTEKTTEKPANPTDRFTGKSTKLTDKPTEKPTDKPTKRTEKPTDKPTKSTERPTKPGKPTDDPIFTIKPITDAPLACDNGKKNGEEWNEKNAADMEFRKKCVDGCILIIGCISQMGTFVPRGKNHTEYWKPNCDLITACIADGTNTTRYHWDDRCNGNTVFTRVPPTEKTSSPKGDTPVTGRPSRVTDKPTDKPTTETYTEKPGSDRCPGGKKAGEVWEESRFVKKCELVEGQGHCVKIVGCLSAKNKAHMEKGENKTETYAGGCTRITYCLDYGRNTTVVDGDLVCPSASTRAHETEAPVTDRPTRGPLFCQNGKKVGVTWIEDDFVQTCTNDGEGKICIKKIACVTPLGHQIKRGDSYVEQDGKRIFKYECVADGESTLFIQRNK